MKNDKILVIFLKKKYIFLLKVQQSNPTWDYNVLIDVISFFEKFHHQYYF